MRSIKLKIHQKLFAMNYTEESKIFTHLTFEEKHKLFELARDCTGKTFVEIGSYLGSSACFIAAGIRKAENEAKLYCMDTWQNDAMTEGQRDTFDEFTTNTKKYKNIIVPLRGWSYDTITELTKSEQQIDFLFLDGDHSYDACKKDWDLYRPLLQNNSIVILHDSGWSEGVQKVIKEDVTPCIKNAGQLPNMYWATIVK